MSDDIQIEKEEDIENKLKKIKEQLKKCRKEKEEYLLGWQRTKADFINARREEEKQREKTVRLANQMLIYELLTVLDSFDLALKQSENKGYQLIKKQLDDTLKKNGLEPIDCLGKKFDPSLHEAAEEVQSREKSGTIINEIQKGYLLNGEVLRPSRVKVAK